MIIVVPRRFSEIQKPVAERNNNYKTSKMIVRNIISVELSYGVSTSAGLTCIDSNALKIDKYDYKITIFKIINSLNNSQMKTQIIF